PKNVTYSVSQDGSEYERVGVKSTAINPKDKEQQTQEFTVTLDQPKSARFVKMEAKNLGVCPEWHDAAGSKAWLFVDEFSIK
ncbi:MAG: beta-N-acetylhexosaminidase, partial [Bacteroidota bacterium]